MNKIDVSIIIPVYNVEGYLERTIESVQRQNFEYYEIVLVDDGSLDRSGQICDQYAAMDSRINVIHKKNGGVMSARYAGVESARGRYIAFLDGDDRMPPNALLKMYDAMMKNDVDYVIGACVDVDSEENRINDKVFYANFDGLIESNAEYRTHIAKYPRGMNMKMYKKELLLAEPRVCISPLIKNNEDLIFNLLLSPKVNRVMSIKDVVALIVNRPGSASRKVYGCEYWLQLFDWVDQHYEYYGVKKEDYMQYKLNVLYYKVLRESKSCDYHHQCFENVKTQGYKMEFGIKRNVTIFVVKHPWKILRLLLVLHPKRFFANMHCKNIAF